MSTPARPVREPGLPCSHVYRIHPQYPFITLGLLGLALYMGSARGSGQDPATLVMVLICLGLASWHAQWWGTRIHISGQGLEVYRLLQGRCTIPWHEIRSVHLAGRVLKSVVIEHGPAAEPSLLALPRMRHQAQMQSRLAAGLHRTSA